MLTPLEAGLQLDPCLFIEEGKEEGPGGEDGKDREVITESIVGRQNKQGLKEDA